MQEQKQPEQQPKQLIRHPLSAFLATQGSAAAMTMPESKAFRSICASHDAYPQLIPNITSCGDALNDIITAHSTGMSFAEIAIKNTIKSCINIVSAMSLTATIDKLTEIRHNRLSIQFMIENAIIGAYTCQISYRGYDAQDLNGDTIPEVLMALLAHFATNPPIITIAGVSAAADVATEIMTTCMHMFEGFLVADIKLDEHNENVSNNFKGLCTVLGLLYAHNLFRLDAVINLMQQIKDAIFAETGEIDCDRIIVARTSIECANIHKGYELFVTHVARVLMKRTIRLCDAPVEILERLLTSINEMIAIHTQMVEKCDTYRARNKRMLHAPIRLNHMRAHQGLSASLNDLRERVKAFLPPDELDNVVWDDDDEEKVEMNH